MPTDNVQEVDLPEELDLPLRLLYLQTLGLLVESVVCRLLGKAVLYVVICACLAPGANNLREDRPLFVVVHSY